jgi:hypothetical protein
VGCPASSAVQSTLSSIWLSFVWTNEGFLGGKRFWNNDEVLQLCKVGYTSNRKPPLKLESRSFQNVDTSVWQSTGTALKSSVKKHFHFIVNKFFRNEFSFKCERS